MEGATLYIYVWTAAGAYVPGLASLDFDQFEIIFGGAAIATLPTGWYILPARARRDSLFGQAFCLVVYEAANNALPFAQLHCAIPPLKSISSERTTWDHSR